MPGFEGKPCRKCGSMEKRADGRCAPCARASGHARYAVNKEKIIAAQRAYHARDPEKQRRRRRAYYAAHLEERRTAALAAGRAYRAADPERYKADRRNKYAADPERYKARSRRAKVAKRTADFLTNLTAIFLDINRRLQHD